MHSSHMGRNCKNITKTNSHDKDRKRTTRLSAANIGPY